MLCWPSQRTASRGGGATDAGTDGAIDPDGGVPITGRVCLVTDLRKLTTCATKGAKNLKISLGGRTTTTTTEDGAFAFTAPLGANLIWRVTGDVDQRIVPTVMPFGPDATLPVISVADYAALQGSNSIVLVDQQGSAVVRVVQGTAPVTGAQVSAPIAQPPILYDASNPTTWNQTQTGAFGVAWLPVIPLAVSPPTTATVTIAPGGGAAAVRVAAPIENLAITFVTKDINDTK